MNWLCPSKERESYGGSRAKEEGTREEEAGRQQALPWFQQLAEEATAASTSPASHGPPRLGPLTLVIVG